MSFQPTYIVNPNMTVKNVQNYFRDDFPGTSVNSSNWTVTTSGTTPPTYSVANSQLSITNSAVASAFVILQSAQTYSVPFRFTAEVSHGTNVSNADLYLDIINGAGDQAFSLQIVGSSSNSVYAYVTNSGQQTSYGSFSYYINPLQFMIEFYGDQILLSGRATNQSQPLSYNLATIDARLPDPNQQYYVRIRQQNAATAPAGTTTYNIDYVTVTDLAQLSIDLTSIRTSYGAAPVGTMPTYIAGTTNYTQNVNISSASSNVNITMGTYNSASSSTLLGANQISTLTAYQFQAYYSKFRASAISDQAGTLTFEASTDGTNFYPVVNTSGTQITAAIPSGGGMVTLDYPTVGYSGIIYMRAKYTNGATAQTKFQFVSGYMNP